MNADTIIRNMAERIVSLYDAEVHRCRNVEIIQLQLEPVRALLIAAEEAGSTCMAIRRAFDNCDRPVLTGLCADAEKLVLAALADMTRCGRMWETASAHDPETTPPPIERNSYVSAAEQGFGREASGTMYPPEVGTGHGEIL